MVVGTELKSFTRAARQLGRSQSAVSMQIKKLEEQAGQPLFRRSGRGLVTTEAGDALLAYAQRIVALNDEAAASLGAPTDSATVRIGLPQDFFEDVMPASLQEFSRLWPGVHVEVHAGRNYALTEDVEQGRLDVVLAFFSPETHKDGTHLCTLPMQWLGSLSASKSTADGSVRLILNDHPCLFRQAALQTLERQGVRCRVSLTTQSLAGIWAALLLGHGITARTAHRIPAGICDLGTEWGLPKLPAIELRMLTARRLSPASATMRDILGRVTRDRQPLSLTSRG